MEYISYNMGTRDFPDIYARALGPGHIYIRQIHLAHVITITNNTGFASKLPSLLVDEMTDDGSDRTHLCCKDLGASKRLHHWSRGHLFICRPCGHIDFSQPMYRSKIYKISEL